MGGGGNGSERNSAGEKGALGRLREYVQSHEYEIRTAVEMSTPAGRGSRLLSRLPWIGRFFGRASIRTIDDVLRNPTLLKGMNPNEIKALLGSTAGWRVEALGQGSRKGEGLILRQYTPAGNPTGRVIQWHPGGGHHGPNPYWKVRSGEGGVSPEIPAGSW